MPTFSLVPAFCGVAGIGQAAARAAALSGVRGRSAPAPVQSFLFAHTPSVVVYDCPGR
ncbi:hypothetical protein [Thermostaphylospora chromogena]|uniref:Uncharacterized protein n=1 Tax=Thermostaphylospora chromogena TaxID=35622 RepID=A0A1H1F4L6_9ACTN|nr:hypothetical protein [Thermostaphylospora chromogena]SDQ95943.1 hypothetical protein SAMN04489764_2787 [Thermostaphylospora chromogena]